MRYFLWLLALSLVPVISSAQQTGVPPATDSGVDCSKDQMFRKMCEDIQKQARDAELKIEKANAKKPEQDLQIPQQSIDQKLENGKWTRKEAKGKSDEEIMKEQAREIAKGLLDNVKKREPPTYLDAAKAAARASTPSSAQAPTVGAQHLTLVQRQEVQKQMEKMYEPYVKAKVEADISAQAAAKATSDYLARKAAADRAAAAAVAAAGPAYRPDYSYRPACDPCDQGLGTLGGSSSGHHRTAH